MHRAWIQTFFCLTLALVPSLRAQARPLKPTYKQFLNFCRAFRQTSPTARIPPPPVGKITFQPTVVFEATQGRFSFDRVGSALDKVIELEKIDKYHPETDSWELPHENNTSVYPEHRRVTGVWYRGKIYIVDGHHRVLVSTYLGAQTVPVHILEGPPGDPEPEAFQKWMKDKNYSHHVNYRGRKIAPRDLCELEDDHYLRLARKVLLRVDWEFDADNNVKIVEQRGAKRVLLLKLNRDIPFLEFEIADRLRRAGFVWREGRILTDRALAKILKILVKRRRQSRLRDVLLLERPTPVAELDLPNVIAKHLLRHRCEYQLLTGDGD